MINIFYFKDDINPSFLFDQIKPGEQKYTEERYYKAFLKMFPALYSRNFRKRLKEDKNLFELLKNEWMENPTGAQDFLNQGAAVLEHDTRDLLRKIKQPSLIIASTKDRLQSVSNSRVVHDELPNSELVVLDGRDELHRLKTLRFAFDIQRPI